MLHRRVSEDSGNDFLFFVSSVRSGPLEEQRCLSTPDIFIVLIDDFSISLFMNAVILKCLLHNPL